MRRGLSVAVPHYNNARFIVQCLAEAVVHEDVVEVVVCDDASEDLPLLHASVRALGSSKVRVVEGDRNLGVHLNKIRAVSHCRRDWVILFDADNVLTKEYIDGLVSMSDWSKNCIYAPGYVEKICENGHQLGSFDYNLIAGTINRRNFFDMPHWTDLFKVMLNTCNYMVPRGPWLDNARSHAPEYDSMAISSLDSMTVLCDWMADGNDLRILSGIGYKHRMHKGSSYIKHMGTINGPAWTEKMYSKIRNAAVE